MKHKIIHVEDAKDYQKMIEMTFNCEEFDYKWFANPHEALESIENKNYDLIISDYMIDDENGNIIMDGFDFVSKAIELKPNLKGKAILLSAKSLDQNEVRRTIELGMKSIKKPASPNDLMRIVSRILND